MMGAQRPVNPTVMYVSGLCEEAKVPRQKMLYGFQKKQRLCTVGVRVFWVTPRACYQFKFQESI